MEAQEQASTAADGRRARRRRRGARYRARACSCSSRPPRPSPTRPPVRCSPTPRAISLGSARSSPGIRTTRTPAQYAEHVHEMLAEYGRFTLTVDEVIAAGDRVYVRWTQHGHVSGRPVVQVASCVYRVDGLIVEYWMQIDRAGLAAQLA
ncbi:ester cyclase [Cellulomonas sp. JH27-2]|uniref:ester cyclase n=1 Tax=Cellulomonas sp. JH27-2 TaxID=2774139 RepID=UPI001785CFF6|nr:ester cyclase [Cellulomonas sp. JH27-2]MBD8058232.1 ester cyclase [Cellulomonas sp. JH27-2]